MEIEYTKLQIDCVLVDITRSALEKLFSIKLTSENIFPKIKFSFCISSVKQIDSTPALSRAGKAHELYFIAVDCVGERQWMFAVRQQMGKMGNLLSIPFFLPMGFRRIHPFYSFPSHCYSSPWRCLVRDADAMEEDGNSRDKKTFQTY